MRISISAERTYTECPRRWHYRYVTKPDVGDRTTPYPMRFGSVVHAGLEAAYSDHHANRRSGSLSPSWPVAANGVRAAWDEYDMPPDGGELDRALGMVARACEVFHVEHSDILGVEHKFVTTTPGGVDFIGYADLILRADETTVEVRDYKVTAKMLSAEELAADMQGCMYAHFALQEWPWAQRVRFSHYYPNHQKLVAVDLDPDTITEMVERFDLIAEMISTDTTFEPIRGDWCDWCEYRGICPAWADDRVLDAMVSF